MTKMFPHKNWMVLALLPAVLSLVCASCDDDDDDEYAIKQEKYYPPVANNGNDASKNAALGRLEFPKVRGDANNMVIVHSTSDSYGINYAVEWDVEKKASRWTAYQMRKGFTGKAGRGEFTEDPDLDAKYRLSDTYSYYRGSGFTRGHICPSADRQYSKEANQQTFYYTNMQPQYYNFNAGEGYTSPWVRLENQVRTWTLASSTEVLYVVKGGTIEDDQLLKKINGELRVPKYFFVALLLQNKEGYKAVGFWMEHSNKAWSGSESLGDFAMNIRDLEELTGIDFFCNLPDDTENRVETLPLANIKRAWGL